MDNVNNEVVAFYKQLGFTLIEIKSSVFRIEESTLVFQTDHKDHTVDASTILYEDAEKIYQDRDQAYTSLVEGIEGMKSDPTLPADDALYSRSDIDREVDKTLTDIIQKVVKPLYGKE